MEKAPIQEIIELSGMPQEGLSEFLANAFSARGLSLENASMDDLRAVLADLLQDLILQSEEH
jgi:hypothetical protein